ncbi:Kinetochore-Ndc80 subunit Spc24 [Lasiodiplodia theobromae]|uniref:Kinetochore protein Spc24 n=1 Tax=Lasiodiplodia theobromae TaxID=45133 RepID=A0A5N5D679_9PEZI|nr:Kinetochore-Ndc80 subunit Spc24 [Lasiodiplodia theobromae]KAB2573111.1 putative kinetochore protein spc24 [Lasiodiplodia theobromae]KAF4533830.1 Kinetochore-Ndc80 subunit Spc24 [Lasiodiplodia theobromae]KAF9638122.1 Kinetochore-Ndc80 subunit Spc24 [Lasiodiplodia theobromae]
MLLDEHPAVIIGQCVSNFNVAPDKAAISRSASSYNDLENQRKSQIKVEQDKLQQLSRQLGSLQSQHNLTTKSHNPAEHAAEILRLDTEKFKVAKQVSDLEIEEERLASELERLKAELEEVDAQGIEGGDVRRAHMNDEDSILLQLRVYRMLGIKPEIDPSTGNYNKATITNPSKGDVHLVTFDPQFSRYFYADYIWNRM